MTSFVQRLVARNSAKVNLPGMAVLQTRPIARFEPIPPLSEVSIETVAPRDRAAGESSNSREQHGGLSRSEAPAAQLPLKRHWNHSKLEPETSVVADGHQSVIAPEARYREFAPRRIPEIVSTQGVAEQGAKVEISTPRMSGKRADPIATENRKSTPPVQTNSLLPPVSILNLAEGDSEQHVARNPNTPTFTPPVPKAAPERSAEKEQPTPSISIGKIEVQFLPANIPAPILSPDPVGNRGFDSYARARRGQPR